MGKTFIKMACLCQCIKFNRGESRVTSFVSLQPMQLLSWGHRSTPSPSVVQVSGTRFPPCQEPSFCSSFSQSAEDLIVFGNHLDTIMHYQSHCCRALEQLQLWLWLCVLDVSGKDAGDSMDKESEGPSVAVVCYILLWLHPIYGRIHGQQLVCVTSD